METREGAEPLSLRLALSGDRPALESAARQLWTLLRRTIHAFVGAGPDGEVEASYLARIEREGWSAAHFLIDGSGVEFRLPAFEGVDPAWAPLGLHWLRLALASRADAVRELLARADVTLTEPIPSLEAALTDPQRRFERGAIRLSESRRVARCECSMCAALRPDAGVVRDAYEQLVSGGEAERRAAAWLLRQGMAPPRDVIGELLAAARGASAALLDELGRTLYELAARQAERPGVEDLSAAAAATWSEGDDAQRAASLAVMAGLARDEAGVLVARSACLSALERERPGPLERYAALRWLAELAEGAPAHTRERAHGLLLTALESRTSSATRAAAVAALGALFAGAEAVPTGVVPLLDRHARHPKAHVAAAASRAVERLQGLPRAGVARGLAGDLAGGPYGAGLYAWLHLGGETLEGPEWPGVDLCLIVSALPEAPDEPRWPRLAHAVEPERLVAAPAGVEASVEADLDATLRIAEQRAAELVGQRTEIAVPLATRLEAWGRPGESLEAFQRRLSDQIGDATAGLRELAVRSPGTRRRLAQLDAAMQSLREALQMDRRGLAHLRQSGASEGQLQLAEDSARIRMKRFKALKAEREGLLEELRWTADEAELGALSSVHDACEMARVLLDPYRSHVVALGVLWTSR